MTVKSEPKKRGRKAKKPTNTTPSVPKKRGRKPKGGKIIENTKITITEGVVLVGFLALRPRFLGSDLTVILR
jgi:hypothetical protein